MLGNFNYIDAHHGWAIETGSELARYDILSGSFTDQEIPNYSGEQKNTVNLINKAFKEQRINIIIPDIKPRNTEVQLCINTLLESNIDDKIKVAFIIGMSAFYIHVAAQKQCFSLRDSSNLACSNKECLNKAQNNIAYLTQRFPELRIDDRKLYQVMLNSLGKTTIIREFLKTA